MKDLYNKVADVTDGVSGFLEKYPGVATALAGSVTAVGLVTGAIVAYTSAVKVANMVTKTLNITMSAGKFGLIVGGIAAAGAAVGGLAHAFSSAKDDVEDYNGTLEQCQSEIERTQADYDAVCRSYGENSEAAQRLAKEVDTLNAQYQKGGGFIADYEQRLAESQEKLNSFTSEYDSKMKSIDDSWQKGMVAAAQLETLSQKTQLTNSDLDMMSKYADYLNNTFNCNIEVDYDTKSLTGFDPNDINSQMIKKADENRKQAASDSVTDGNFQIGYIDSIKKVHEIEDEYKRVKSEITKVMNDPGADVMIEHFESVAEGFENAGESAEKAQEVMTPQEIAATAWSEYQSQIEELCTAYDEAYNAAYESFQGQFGLFEESRMHTANPLSRTLRRLSILSSRTGMNMAATSKF